jgi:hypothetical protein
MNSGFDPSQLTKAERQKITKRAGRNIGSEVTLILTAGFSLLMVLLFWFGDLSFLPLSELLGIRPTLTWIGLAASISIASSLVYGWVASSAVARAQKQQFEIHKFDGANKRAETAEKIKVLKNTPRS